MGLCITSFVSTAIKDGWPFWHTWWIPKWRISWIRGWITQNATFEHVTICWGILVSACISSSMNKLHCVWINCVHLMVDSDNCCYIEWYMDQTLNAMVSIICQWRPPVQTLPSDGIFLWPVNDKSVIVLLLDCLLWFIIWRFSHLIQCIVTAVCSMWCNE